MTSNFWQIRENGLKRVGINFKPGSLIFNPNEIRITLGSKEGNLDKNPINAAQINNNSEFNKYQLIDAITQNSSNRYAKLAKIFYPETSIYPNHLGDGYIYTIGVKGRSNKYYTEDCSLIRTSCLNGDLKSCAPGRCYGGDFEFLSNQNLIQLNISRNGNLIGSLQILNKFTEMDANSIYDYQIDIANDSDRLIYNPGVLSRDFLKSIKGKIRLPLQLLYEVNGHGDFLKNFFNDILFYIFKSSCAGPAEICIKNAKNRLESADITSFVSELTNRINSLNYSDFIKSQINSAISSINTYSSLDDFVSQCYNQIYLIFNSVSYSVNSGFTLANKKKFRGELRGRPIYQRLPSSNSGYNVSGLEDGVIFVDNLDSRFNLQNIDSGQLVVLNDRSEGYRYIPRFISSISDRLKYGLPLQVTDLYDKNQIYSPKDSASWRKLDKNELPPVPVTEWVVEGADEFLIESKEKIDRFFNEFLNPDTCFSENLDWLAQHIGLNDSLYRSAASDKIKRILIKNALGWNEESLSFDVAFPDGSINTYLTTKGKVLNDIPFSDGQWSDTSFTSSPIVKSYTLSGTKTIDGSQISLKSNQKIGGSGNSVPLLENQLVIERSKLLSSDGYFLIFDQDFSSEYEYILVRFYGSNLPSFISSTEKYYLYRVDINKYELYSDFGVKISPNEFIANSDIFVQNLFKVNISNIPNFIYNKNIWEGIHQSKGNMMGLAFALSLPVTKTEGFVHAHVLEEVEGRIIDGQEIYYVKQGPRIHENGLSQVEIGSPLLRPWQRNYLQVGDEAGNFDNQLIAGVGEVKEDGEAYDLVFRLPFYYNRNGRTWNHVLNIKEYWLPANVNARIQYPYLASEVWAVGDAFFELEING